MNWWLFHFLFHCLCQCHPEYHVPNGKRSVTRNSWKNAGCFDEAPWSHCSLINPYDCYQEAHRRNCCSTCEAYKRNIPGCAYGDLNPDWCVSSAQCIRQNDVDDCCETCNKYRESENFDPSNVVDSAAYSNDASIGICPRGDQRLPLNINNIILSCQDIATSYPYYCYTLEVYNACCSTCEGVRDVEVDGCGWGDKNVNSCGSLGVRDCGSFYNWSLCCKTCNFLNGWQGFGEGKKGRNGSKKNQMNGYRGQEFFALIHK